MNLFCFASKNEENIRRGVESGKWAVSEVSETAMRGRITKARKYLTIGSYGLLYCGETSSFTTPFIVSSQADPAAVEIDIWPEPWKLPFSIQPLGGPEKQIRGRIAAEVWSIFQRREPGHGGVTAALNATGTTVFSPVWINEDEWAEILCDLAYD